MIKFALAIVVVFAAAQQLAQADKGRAVALQRRAVVLGVDLRREASCETWASAYAEQPSDERGFRAAHCVARVGEYFRGVSIDGLAHGVESSAAGVQISGFGNF